MIDPLQTEQDPYEVLKVTPLVGDADLHKAFTAAIGRRCPNARDARNQIKDPINRALIDLLKYDDAFLESLDPALIRNSARFTGGNRLETALTWENLLAERFPDLDLGHSLAVLWYWWARSASENSASSQDDPQNPGLEELCANAVGYWSWLLTDDSFWSGWKFHAAIPMLAVKEAIEARIRDLIRDTAFKFRDRDALLSGRLSNLDLLFTYELQTAPLFSMEGVQFHDKSVCCGPLLQRRLRIQNAVMRTINNLIPIYPGRPILQRLRETASPRGFVLHLMESDRPRAALDYLDRNAEREAVIGLAVLKCEAHVAVAGQQAAAGLYRQAADSWAEAARAAHGTEDGPAFRARAVEQARAWAPQQIDAAAALLEACLTITNAEDIRSALAVLLRERGLRRADQGASGNAMVNVDALVSRSGSAADAGDWKEAIRLLRTAIDELTAGERQTAANSGDPGLKEALADLHRAAVLGDRAALDEIPRVEGMLGIGLYDVKRLTPALATALFRYSDQLYRQALNRPSGPDRDNAPLLEAVECLTEAARYSQRSDAAALQARIKRLIDG